LDHGRLPTGSEVRQGFNASGFANAEGRYGGSDGTASLAHANRDKAVSQYDIACIHDTAAHV